MRRSGRLPRRQTPAAQPRPASLAQTLKAPSGELTAIAIGQTLCMLMPEGAILVDEGATNGSPIFEATKGARAHDYLNPDNGGAIGGGLPMALGAAVACPDRKVVHLQADGCGMYTVQALWSMAREKADVVVVLLKNDAYAILGLEMARVREQEINAKTKTMLDLDNPALDWVKISTGTRRACDAGRNGRGVSSAVRGCAWRQGAAADRVSGRHSQSASCA